MGLIDKTNEFVSILTSIRTVSQIVVEEPTTSTTPFSDAASRTAKMLAINLVRLQQLSKLIASSNVLNDQSNQIKLLSEQIRYDINEAQNTISHLDTEVSKKKVQSELHHNAMIANLKNTLFSTTQSLEGQLKTHSDKLAEVEQRNYNLGLSNNNFLGQSADGTGFINMQGEQSQQLLQSVTLVQTDQRLQQRAEQINAINRNIADISSMYNQLGVYIEQGNQDLARIDENLEETNIHLNEAQRFLQKALQRSQGNKMLILKIAGMLILFAIIFSFIK